jgi:hypothetical protein
LWKILWFWNICLSLLYMGRYSPGMWKCSLVLVSCCQYSFASHWFCSYKSHDVGVLVWDFIPNICTAWRKACTPLCKLSSEFGTITWLSANNMVFNFVSFDILIPVVYFSFQWYIFIMLVIKGSSVWHLDLYLFSVGYCLF